MMIDGSTPPMSFMMMGNNNNNNGFGEPPFDPFVGVSMLPMTMSTGDSTNGILVGSSNPKSVTNNSSTTTLIAGNSSSSNSIESPFSMVSPTMLMPSMTMTIQSEPGGSSAIELSTNMLPGSNNSMSSPLIQQPLQRPFYPAKWTRQQLYQQQQQHSGFNENFDEPLSSASLELGSSGGGGEQYYSSPWNQMQRLPLASPAKVFRNEKLRQQQQHRRQTTTTTTSTTTSTTPAPAKLQEQPLARMPPILVIKNHWRPAQAGREQQQQPQSSLEFEELIPVGPPQMMPIYQTPNGQLHMSPPSQRESQHSPPPPAKLRQPDSGEQEEPNQGTGLSSRNNEIGNEVQTINAVSNNGLIILDQSSPENPTTEPGNRLPPAARSQAPSEFRQQPSRQQQQLPQRLISPAVKGKQQSKSIASY